LFRILINTYGIISSALVGRNMYDDGGVSFSLFPCFKSKAKVVV